jgi:hypothetical protein
MPDPKQTTDDQSASQETESDQETSQDQVTDASAEQTTDDQSASPATESDQQTSQDQVTDASAGETTDDQSASQETGSDQETSQDQVTDESAGQTTDDQGASQQTTDDQTSDSTVPATGGSSSSSTASVDYDTDMQTIRDYVHAVVEAKSKIATAYLSAIDNFQTTVQSASPTEAKPDILGTILKSGLKTIEKTAISAVKEATHADLGPLDEMAHAIYDEIDRAAKAAESLAVGEWIKKTRTSITDAYTQDQTGEALRNQLETEYKNHDEGGRGGYIGGVQIELEAVRTINNKDAPKVPKVEVIEVAFYSAWINQYFNDDCMDGTGFIYLQFNDDGTPDSATVNAPLGDKIAGALNNSMAGAGLSRLLDLDVVKKLCKGDACMCFEGNNVVRKAALNDSVQSFLSSQENWKKFSRFSTGR